MYKSAKFWWWFNLASVIWCATFFTVCLFEGESWLAAFQGVCLVVNALCFWFWNCEKRKYRVKAILESEFSKRAQEKLGDGLFVKWGPDAIRMVYPKRLWPWSRKILKVKYLVDYEFTDLRKKP